MLWVQVQASDEPENDSPGAAEKEPLLDGRDQPGTYTGVI